MIAMQSEYRKQIDNLEVNLSTTNASLLRRENEIKMLREGVSLNSEVTLKYKYVIARKYQRTFGACDVFYISGLRRSPNTRQKELLLDNKKTLLAQIQ